MYHEWPLANSRTNFLFYFRDLSPSLSTLFVLLLYCEVVCIHFSPGSIPDAPSAACICLWARLRAGARRRGRYISLSSSQLTHGDRRPSDPLSGLRLADVRSEIGISPALVCSSAHSPLEEENESLVATLCCTHSILAWSVYSHGKYVRTVLLFIRFPCASQRGVGVAEGERGKENGIENWEERRKEKEQRGGKWVKKREGEGRKC